MDRSRRGIWTLIEEHAAASRESHGPSLWDRVAERVDPLRARPKLAPDVEIKEFRLRWGNDYAMMGNPRTLTHYRLEPEDVGLLRLMDGTRTVKEIVVERFEDSGDLHLSGVADLVELLRVEGFLEETVINAHEAVRRAIEPGGRVRRAARRFLRTLMLEWGGADRMVRWLYRNGIRWSFRRPAVLLAGLFSVTGFAAFVSTYRSHRFAFTGASPVAESLILLALGYLLTFVHELGHAATLVHFGRRVKSAGFMIYFGSPAFFVDASEGLMLDRRQRIAQAFGGPFAEMVMAGVAALVVWAFPDGPAAGVLYKFCFLNYFVLFMNLVPFLELDGYWILSDVIQVPDLRPRSLAFLREDLLRKLREREPFSRPELGLALYGLLGVAFTVFSVWTAVYFWWAVFGGLVRSLWNGGALSRGLLVALALFVGGPAIRGLIGASRALARRGRALLRRILFRLETGWRVEAAELIDGLAIFEELPVDTLNDLAGRVGLRTVPRGRAVIRQGERADALYVVRRGMLQVVEEDRQHRRERIVRTLGRGESFGELGLVEAAPRSATVRAVEDAELFEIDKGTFELFLAQTVHLPDLEPTVQTVEELRSLPSFSHLEFDELAELTAHGRWLWVAPGEAIVRQGEEGDAFYAIGSGRVDVYEDGTLVRQLGAGDAFGEIALLQNVPRTATVVAVTPARVFRLDREGFERVMVQAFGRGTVKPAPEAAGPWQH